MWLLTISFGLIPTPANVSNFKGGGKIGKSNFTTTAPVASTIELISKLRKQTHAPIAKCREILLQCNLDYSKAVTEVEEYIKNAGMKRTLNGDLALKASMIFARVTE